MKDESLLRGRDIKKGCLKEVAFDLGLHRLLEFKGMVSEEVVI